MAIEEEVFGEEALTRRQTAHLLRSTSSATILARLSGHPVGFVAIAWRRGASTCRIVNLAVCKRVRHRGIGGRLVRAALAFGRRQGYLGVTLEVEEGNRTARILYSRHGFLDQRRLPDYYDEGRHARRLVRWLVPAEGD